MIIKTNTIINRRYVFGLHILIKFVDVFTPNIVLIIKWFQYRYWYVFTFDYFFNFSLIGRTRFGIRGENDRGFIQGEDEEEEVAADHYWGNNQQCSTRHVRKIGHVDINQSQSVCLPFHLSICLSIGQSTVLPVCPSIHVFVYFSIVYLCPDLLINSLTAY